MEKNNKKNNVDIKEKIFNIKYKDLIEAIYQALLFREADEGGLKTYSKILDERGIADVIRGIIESKEFFIKYTEFTSKKKNDIYTAYNKPVYIIIHILKTAGTSLRKYLNLIFEDKSIDPAPSIKHKAMATLPIAYFLKYKFIMAHMDYDFVSLIPRKKKFLITFLRDPFQRLWSEYNFLKSHNVEKIDPVNPIPSHPLLYDACKYPPEEFFSKHKNSEIIWNTMSKFILGVSLFRKIKNKYLKIYDHKERKAFLDEKVKPIIKNRLKKFFFIGIQEDFETAVRSLVKKLGKQPISEIPKENVTGKTQNILIKPDFKKLPLTKDAIKILKPFVEIDKILYEEGKKLYYEKFRQNDLPKTK